MFNPITQTSFILPRRREDIFTRPRLHDLLRQQLQKKLILLIAPAGYGKTTCLIDFAHSSDQTICWYTIDQDDKNLILFLENVVTAIERQFPDFGRVSREFIHKAYLPEVGMDRIITVLVNEIYEKIPEDVILVLDDFHLVEEDKDIRYFISRFIQRVGENFHLILSSRRQPLLPNLELLTIRSQVGYLGLADLAFQPFEIQQLVEQNYGYSLSKEELDHLALETEGWITGLVLSPRLDRSGQRESKSMTRLPGAGLYRYLEQQILAPLPSEIRKFLLRTSLFYDFDARLCEDVLGEAVYQEKVDWDQFIGAVVQDNLFVLTFPEQENRFRYAQFFRQFLQVFLEKELPGEKSLILTRLAEVQVEKGAYDEAFKSLSELGDIRAVARLIETAGAQLVREGRYATLQHWLDQIPAAFLDSSPHLLSLKGIVMLFGKEGAKAIPLLNQAVRDLHHLDDKAGLAQVLMRRSAAHQFLGDPRAALEDAQEALNQQGNDPESGMIRAAALKTIGVCLHDLGRTDEALSRLFEALAIYRSHGDLGHVASTLLDLGMVYRGRGELGAAEEVYLQAMDFLRGTSDKTRLTNVLNNLGRFLLLQGDYPEAAGRFNQAMEYAVQIGYSRMEAFIYLSFGDLYAELEAYEAAQRAYFRSRQLARKLRHRSLNFYLDLAEAALTRQIGKTREARSFLHLAGKYALVSGSIQELSMYRLELGITALSENQFEEALEALDGALSGFIETKRKLSIAQTIFYLALTHYRLKLVDRSLLLLGQALTMQNELEGDQTLVIAGRDGIDLLEYACGDRKIQGLASCLLDRVHELKKALPSLRRQVRERATALPFIHPWIMIQGFGEPEVRIHNLVLEMTDWQSPRQLEIFFFIIIHPNGVTRKKVEEVFWPDLESPGKKFENAIYRLRNVVGHETILLVDNRYVFNRKLDYSCDVESFLNKAEHAEQTSDIDEKLEDYRQMVGLYRGPFFPSAESNWADLERERFAQYFLKAAYYLANDHLSRKEFPLTLDYCSRILAKDECQEQAHRLAMQAFSGLGNRQGIEKQYRWCVEALLTRWGLEPSEQTRLEYERLIR